MNNKKSGNIHEMQNLSQVNMYDGIAVVYCEGAFQTTYGKTAHGLVRFTDRYKVAFVIDSQCAGQDAGMLLDSKNSDILIVNDLDEAIKKAKKSHFMLSYFVVGITPEDGFLTDSIKNAVLYALKKGLNVDSGLHDFVSDLPEAQKLIKGKNIRIRDIRKVDYKNCHVFTGKIEQVKAVKIAILGTDSAIGKRTTAWILVHAMEMDGMNTQLIGTGQTSWLQGARYGIVLDSIINDYVSGEIENAIWTAWNETHMDYAIIEGQGSFMNPRYPGGCEILAAGRPDAIIMQYAPMRKAYDGFNGYPIDSLADQIYIAEFLSHKKVIAVSINHEGIANDKIDQVCKEVENSCGLPTFDALTQGLEQIVTLIKGL